MRSRSERAVLALLVGACVWFSVVIAACLSSATMTTTSNLAADISNVTQRPLLDAFKAESMACIRANDAGAVLELEVRACFARVDETWRPIWEARARVQDAQNALASTIERGEPTSHERARLEADWCRLREVARPRLELPALGLCGEAGRSG